MFVKLFQQILDSSIADNRKLRHFFTDLLLCSDSTGLVMMTPAAIARRIGADLEEVMWGLKELESPDPDSKTPDNEGRRIERLEGVGYGWRVINYEHYRALKDADQLREATRERVKRHRASKSRNADVTQCNNSNVECNDGNAMQKQIAEAEVEALLPPSQAQSGELFGDVEESPKAKTPKPKKELSDSRHKNFIQAFEESFLENTGSKYHFKVQDGVQLAALLKAQPSLELNDWSEGIAWMRAKGREQYAQGWVKESPGNLSLFASKWSQIAHLASQQ